MSNPRERIIPFVMSFGPDDVENTRQIPCSLWYSLRSSLWKNITSGLIT